jgi:hypothetical protein
VAGRPQPFVAQYPGYCYECDGIVKVGDQATYVRTQPQRRRQRPKLLHAGCAGYGLDWGGHGR